MSAEEVSYRSKKLEIWQEKVRLDEEVERLEQRIRLLEARLEEKAREKEQLQRQLEFDRQQTERLQRGNERLAVLSGLISELPSLDRERLFDHCLSRLPFLFDSRQVAIYRGDDSREKVFLERHSHSKPPEEVLTLDSVPDLAARVESGELCFGADGTLWAPLVFGERFYGLIRLLPGDSSAPDAELDGSILEQVASLVSLRLRNLEQLFEAEQEARMDALTRLYNHRAFVDQAAQEVERADRYEGHLSLILLDVVGFRALNDNYGTLAGDEVLRQVASVVRKSLRRVDPAARWGDDSFAILLPQQDLEGAMIVARRLKEELSHRTIRHRQQQFEIDVAVAVCQHRQGGIPGDLLRRAGEALRRAQESPDEIKVAP